MYHRKKCVFTYRIFMLQNDAHAWVQIDNRKQQNSDKSQNAK